ncbi:MAG: hypothetical protein RLZZ630_972 [Bacteroidota bacterium]
MAKTSKPTSAPAKHKTEVIPFFPLLIVLLYALVEWLPRFKAVDVMGSQWLFLSVLNAVVAAYLFRQNSQIPSGFFRTGPFITGGGFLLVAALSFLTAFNPVESLVTYNRLVVAGIAFFNMSVLLSAHPDILRPAIRIIAVVLIVQSAVELVEFLDSIKSRKPLDELIMNLKGNTGNKNFLGAGTLLRIPFLLFLFHDKRFGWQALAVPGLIISLTTLFVLNSRSTIVALLFISALYIGYIVVRSLKDGDRKILLRPGLYIVAFALSFLITQSLFDRVQRLTQKGQYGAVAERLASISFTNEGSAGRVMLWQSALDFIGKNPLLGGGIGNWKIHSIPYEATTIRGFGLKKHIHNDYLEVTADTGIGGGLLFTAFLGLIFLLGARLLLGRNLPEEWQAVVMVLLLSHTAYMSDSLFNFPLERPNMVLHMLFSGAALTGLYARYGKKEKPENSTLNRTIPFVMLIPALGTVWVNWQCYRSMVAQDKIAIEWFGKPQPANPPFKSEEVNPMFPSIPNLNELGMPIACMKAKYLAQEGKHAEARAILDAGNNANPYLYFAEFLRANMALTDQQTDSAIHYGKVLYYNRPANQQAFDMLYGMLRDMRDTVEMMKAFGIKTNTRPEPTDYLLHSESMYVLKKDMEARKSILKDGIKRFPESERLHFQLLFTQGFELTEKGDNKSAAEMYIKSLAYVKDPQALLNAGIELLKSAQYERAIPYFTDAIATGKFNNGIPEYGRGLCYFNRNLLDQACPDIRTAATKGYAVEAKVAVRCGGQ